MINCTKKWKKKNVTEGLLETYCKTNILYVHNITENVHINWLPISNGIPESILPGEPLPSTCLKMWGGGKTATNLLNS